MPCVLTHIPEWLRWHFADSFQVTKIISIIVSLSFETIPKLLSAFDLVYYKGQSLVYEARRDKAASRSLAGP